MRLSRKKRSFLIGRSTVEIGRTANGVIEIFAEDAFATQRALGFAHAHDRMQQMFLSRILGEGRLSELIYDSDETYGVDFLSRKMGFASDAAQDTEALTDEAKKYAEAYCEGVNAYFQRYGPPFVFRFLKKAARNWEIRDILLLIKTHIYFGMAQLQERVERFIIQALHDGVSLQKLKQLFSPHLSGMKEQHLSLLKQIRLERPYLDRAFSFTSGISNNWAVSSKKTAPFFCFDPHLQVNRLPNMWAEVICHMPDQDWMGISTPGVPGIVMGRNRHLAYSFTYGMMDVIDFFIEECRDGHVRREKSYKPLQKREEIIYRKKQGPTHLWFYESEGGVIEREKPDEERIKDGLYLSVAWSAAHKGASPVLNALPKLWQSHTVTDAQIHVRDITMSCNWVFADREGNIGYQQSGRLPKRAKASGLYPLPAWEKETLWDGFVEGKQLKSLLNPKEGFVATANNDQNEPNKPPTITLPIATYRYQRIHNVLSKDKSPTLEGMKALQTDLYSLQAELFMNQIRPLLQDTALEKMLKNWDCQYTKESREATLFESIYKEILKNIFGKLFGEMAWKQITEHHSLLVYTYGLFDTILLQSEDPNWFGNRGKAASFREAIELVLNRFQEAPPQKWGEIRTYLMKNLLFNGKLPKWLKLDIGPLILEGSRATISAAHLFREGNRTIVAAPSYRFITDLASDQALTILAGGPSERWLSPYYASEVQSWTEFTYKTLTFINL